VADYEEALEAGRQGFVNDWLTIAHYNPQIGREWQLKIQHNKSLKTIAF
jgi:hypothetical protein